jgi:hypothetical protein
MLRVAKHTSKLICSFAFLEGFNNHYLSSFRYSYLVTTLWWSLLQPVTTMPKAHPDVSTLRVQKVLNEFGSLPLAETSLAKKALSPKPEIVLAMIMDAMLKSRPIQHDLSQKSVNHLIEVGYYDIEKLSKSTWEERTDVLREGGYNRYREQGATNLGALAEFVQDNYGMCWHGSNATASCPTSTWIGLLLPEC